MKVPRDALISALLHPRLRLTGDSDGGVAMRCMDHGDNAFAYYREGTPDAPATLGVVHVATIPGLWAQAVDHLAATHQDAGHG